MTPAAAGQADPELGGEASLDSFADWVPGGKRGLAAGSASKAGSPKAAYRGRIQPPSVALQAASASRVAGDPSDTPRLGPEGHEPATAAGRLQPVADTNAAAAAVIKQRRISQIPRLPSSADGVSAAAEAAPSSRIPRPMPGAPAKHSPEAGRVAADRPSAETTADAGRPGMLPE